MYNGVSKEETLMIIGICDDEAVIRESGAALVRKVDRDADVVMFASAAEVRDYLKDNTIDLLFLDVEMDMMSGLELKDLVESDTHLGYIVFVSGYHNYVFRAFGPKTLGYVVKPAEAEDIRKWIREVDNRLHNVAEVSLDKDQTMNARDIMFVLSDGHYCDVYLKGRKEPVTVAKTMAEIEKILAGKGFGRCHKQYLVNLAEVKSVDKTVKLLTWDKPIPVSRRKAQDFYNDYRNYVRMKVLEDL